MPGQVTGPVDQILRTLQSPHDCVLFSSCPFVADYDLESLSPESIAELAFNQCFSIPRRHILHQLMMTYFQVVHPVMPVVDEGLIWRALTEHGPENKISLLLLQSIIFASCSFVPLPTLYELGYSTHNAARLDFYQRARTLFDLNAQADVLVQAQAATLLSYSSSLQVIQSGRIWIARAIRIASTLNDSLSTIQTPYTRSMVKRLWWCILLRDTNFSVALYQPPQISPVHLAVYGSWLEESDFAFEMEDSLVYSKADKLRLLEALRQRCQVAMILTDALQIIFPSLEYSSLSNLSNRLAQDAASLDDTLLSLECWAERSPPVTMQGSIVSDVEKFVSLMSHLTYMLFHAAKLTITHHKALILERRSRIDHRAPTIAANALAAEIHRDVDGLIETIEYFASSASYTSFQIIPQSVLAYSGMPLILSAIDYKLAPSYSEMVTRKRRFDALSAILHRCRTIYEISDVALACINQMLQFAYAITRDIFLSGKNGNAQVNKSLSNLSIVRRATSLPDAYTLYPYAYLCITKLVERTVSGGKLVVPVGISDKICALPSTPMSRISMSDSVSLAQLEIIPSSGTGRPNSVLESSSYTTCNSSNGLYSMDGQQTAQLAKDASKDTAEAHVDLLAKHVMSLLARNSGRPGRTDKGSNSYLDYLDLDV
ncbi:hypothetical protein VHEMI04292 [[Torrubiella] hemipterigena]|nr:hypothetical protein VHEMI04292 [[Torrubiella] hemipterigena]